MGIRGRMGGKGIVFFFQAEDGIRDVAVTGVQTCALPISIFSSVAVADGLLQAGLASILPATYVSLIQGFVDQGRTVSPEPEIPPGFIGLLKKICAGVSVPNYKDPFLPLIRDHVKSRARALHLKW